MLSPFFECIYSFLTFVQTQSILESRTDFVKKVSIVFSGVLRSQGRNDKATRVRTSLNILEKAGIPIDDPAGWLIEASRGKSGGKCGVHTEAYFNSRDSAVEELLDKLEAELEDYKCRVESIESYVYMQCVGIQLEKNFSKKRAEALAGMLNCTIFHFDHWHLLNFFSKLSRKRQTSKPR